MREAWRERFGESKTAWRDVPGRSCDAGGCVLVCGGHNVLLAFTADALAEDCAAKNFTVSAVSARDLCRNAPVVDVIDLARDGAVEVWMNEGGVHTHSVRDGTGNRVWMRGISGEEDNDLEP